MIAAGDGRSAAPLSAPVVAERLAAVRDRIAAAGRDPAEVAVVAVTKGFGAPAVRAAAYAGLGDLGENYAQELVAKAAALAAEPPVRWHFLGAVQRNKIARLAPLVELWQTVERAPVLEGLARARPGAAVLVQVNVTGEAGKAGCRPEQVGELVDEGRSLGLDVRGLMCVGTAGDPAGTRRSFARTAELAGAHGLGQLSMGMTDDFELAVAEGATMVRLGRVLFGARPGRSAVRR